MKPIVKSILVLAVVLVPTLASAQGYYGPAPYPGGFHHRRVTWGVGIGLGGMGDDGGSLTCSGCGYNPFALEFDAHLGGFVTPRFALMVEVQANGQTVSANADGSTSTLVQTALMLAGQYWLTPQLWIKGGVGFANLQQNDNNFDGTAVTPVDNGFAVMGALGFELLSSRRFALDLQGRIIEGSYDGIDDHITSGTIGLGFSWY
jgi:hypothetical protein